MIGYCNTGSNADAYAALTPSDREARAIAQGVKIHGDKYRTGLATSFSHHWRQTPYPEASWHSPSGGPDAPAFTPLNRAAGRVCFAGDHLSYADAWQHSAFTSARKAVTALHARVLAQGLA
ncbi:FAD-dependent oxidoreductase [Streptomyces sp. NPDC059153]|uniref:FAD-dependent oxidoreductase n=1 Tax=Streptomyces sp. NPDC059153 TaxID=3346743 RepID=UPI00367B1E4F